MMMMDESVVVSSVIHLLLCWHKSTLFLLQMVLKGVKMVHGGLTTVI